MSLTRLPAVPAVGAVTFSRYTATSTSLVLAGALVRTGDGTLTFAIASDTTNSVWSAELDGYCMNPGVASISVPIVAQTAGGGSNVLANTISLIATAMPGVDLVTNPTATHDGLDAEGDAAFRARFQNYLQSLSRATIDAVGYSISSTQQGLEFAIAENVDTGGLGRMGSFVITVDDGSGYPPSSLLSTIYASVDSVRPIGSIFAVQPPIVTLANVTMAIILASTNSNANLILAVTSVITSYINSLTIGEALPITRLAQVAYDANSAVINVTLVQINGSVADLVPGSAGIIKAGSVSVN
jgi:uncharacterized phage protein gp47/JayE